MNYVHIKSGTFDGFYVQDSKSIFSPQAAPSSASLCQGTTVNSDKIYKKSMPVNSSAVTVKLQSILPKYGNHLTIEFIFQHQPMSFAL